MKINELFQFTDSTVVNQEGDKYKVGENNLYNIKNLKKITSIYELSEIVKMDFHIDVDWSNVPIDTPVFVWDHSDNMTPGYFAGYDPNSNDPIKIFYRGQTSFTCEEKKLWKLPGYPEGMLFTKK